MLIVNSKLLDPASTATETVTVAPEASTTATATIAATPATVEPSITTTATATASAATETLSITPTQSTAAATSTTPTPTPTPPVTVSNTPTATVKNPDYETKLICNETALTMKFNKTQLDERKRDYSIKFKGESIEECMVYHTNSSHVMDGYIWISSNYNKCGIDIYEEDDDIVYNQTVIITYGYDPTSSGVYREEHDEFSVSCHKHKNFTRSMDVVNVTDVGDKFSKGKKELISKYSFFCLITNSINEL